MMLRTGTARAAIASGLGAILRELGCGSQSCIWKCCGGTEQFRTYRRTGWVYHAGMPLSLLFWVLMVIWLVFGWWGAQPTAPPWSRFGGSLLNFILFAILGWAVFGAAIK